MQKEMVDLGYTYPKSSGGSGGVAGPMPEEDNKKHYPTLYLSDIVPDFLMDKDVGKKCRLEIEVEIKQKGINEDGKKKRQNMDLKVMRIGIIGMVGKLSKDEYLNASDEEREANDSPKDEE